MGSAGEFCAARYRAVSRSRASRSMLVQSEELAPRRAGMDRQRERFDFRLDCERVRSLDLAAAGGGALLMLEGTDIF